MEEDNQKSYSVSSTFIFLRKTEMNMKYEIRCGWLTLLRLILFPYRRGQLRNIGVKFLQEEKTFRATLIMIALTGLIMLPTPIRRRLAPPQPHTWQDRGERMCTHTHTPTHVWDKAAGCFITHILLQTNHTHTHTTHACMHTHSWVTLWRNTDSLGS